jgi:hypothetical protein
MDGEIGTGIEAGAGLDVAAGAVMVEVVDTGAGVIIAYTAGGTETVNNSWICKN